MSFTADILNTCGVGAVGTKTVFYIAEAHDVNPFPDPGVGTKIISSDITCKTGKKFIRVEAVYDTTGVKWEVTGDIAFQSIVSKFMFAIKTIDVAKNNLMDTLIGCGVIALTEDKNANGCWVFGEPENPSFVSVGTAESGLKSGDKNWYNYELSYNGKGTPYFYTGDRVDFLTPAA